MIATWRWKGAGDMSREKCKTISFSELNDTDEPCADTLIDIETVPAPQRQDYRRRNENVAAGAALCLDCDGTGNAHFFSYKECIACKGSGRSQFTAVGA